MVSLSRSGRVFLGLSAAAMLGFVMSACEAGPAKSVLGPSATAGGSLRASRAESREGTVQGAASDDHQLLAAIRLSTAKYQNIDAAFADGYVDDGYGCVDATLFGLDRSVGGMGFHLINWQLHDDPATDPLRPDLLVYEPAPSPSGKPKLVALEYENFRSDWWAAGNTAPPSLFGHEFESIDLDGLELFGLHIWLWLDNPTGMFSDFNPKTSCP